MKEHYCNAHITFQLMWFMLMWFLAYAGTDLVGVLNAMRDFSFGY